MKHFFQSFYGKLSILFLVLLILMGAAQIWVTIKSTEAFYKEAEQTLNLKLANDLIPDFEPFLEDSIDYAGIKHMFHYMMVINPNIEIYLLDGKGKIMAFFAEPNKKVQKENIDLVPIRQFLNEERESLLVGDDPRHPGSKKAFSVAPINIGKDMSGFLYVILGSEQFDSAIEMIRQRYLTSTIIRGLLISVLVTGILGLVLFAFLTRRLRNMNSVVQDFEQGQFHRRADVATEDEVGQLAGSFNKMADTIVANMEELQKTDKLRRELIANVSHDLRSPLASIKGYLETLQIKESDLTSETRREYVDTILNVTNGLEGLVDQLFELSKLDAMQIQPELEPFSIADLVQDVVMKFKPVADKSNIKLEASLSDQLPQVHADIGLIERALSNLIDNALRYTPENGTVEVRIENSQKKVRVYVSDTGYGIKQEELPLIFDRFYRVEKSRAKATGGSGLGLAITKKILEIHQSNINVESKVNEGTTFSFNLDAWRPAFS